MNLTPLFEVQRKLDDKIVQEKGLEGQDLLPEKVLALLVELGELANEWRGFKFWSEGREARTEYVCKFCEGSELVSTTAEFGNEEQGFDLYEVDVSCPVCDDVNTDKNPLLEEYVDCLHFILSIGNDLQITDYEVWTHADTHYVRHQFTEVFDSVTTLNLLINLNDKNIQVVYEVLVARFLALGEMLGFTWKQITQAYMEKNRVNHERQANGY
ncbi:dUTP diphosphatase [Paenalkalicoccus suaedae]|uniref:dUTP diphosphatase n=1 Tax=Paenalkalicoccus suaedae TaxID=2592382 RepID=A0A859FFS7_9BACI|nr:dUTP diphosphatase [Paenalkalicoccus suaedae]QKS71678.1 dUTP diphosphatase [Paenalkalicoccus suaedae]QKS71731.1 dUTP diphosphatase [Paenalkalicoccus suaedae]